MDRTVDGASIGVGDLGPPVARKTKAARLNRIGLDINLDVDDLFESLRNADICLPPQDGTLYDIDALAFAEQMRAEARARRSDGTTQNWPRSPNGRAG